MNNSKKHHYVPACYLKGFTNGGKRSSLFWAFPVDKVGIRHGTNPNDACVSNNYYKLEENINPLCIEHWYGDSVEPRIGEFLEQAETLEKIDPNDEGLIWLLTSLLLRNPLHRAAIEMPLMRAKTIASSMKRDSEKKGITLNTSIADYIKDDLLELELQQTKVASLYLPHYNYCLVKAPSGVNTITSDAPLLLLNPTHKTYGLNTIGTMIIAPLNKNTLIAGSNQLKLPSVHNARKEDICDYNAMIMVNANEKCFSNENYFLYLNDMKQITKYPN